MLLQAGASRYVKEAQGGTAVELCLYTTVCAALLKRAWSYFWGPHHIGTTLRNSLTRYGTYTASLCFIRLWNTAVSQCAEC